ncbi:uncharacterized protein F4812DRAFT_460729 [Daldinia caldariorum]|uniref:uncharacterized protein n=1 Tax=Daldinia caldariorum TaxID=326644 RepID=UPI002007E05E|nr:uncharacterized protein F4812DRAFT_460729 [Daldinia caldariorum]KAI1466459.1 hypothetical protein F4812DRAFT_460729 [Daldinia caldariorum]
MGTDIAIRLQHETEPCLMNQMAVLSANANANANVEHWKKELEMIKCPEASVFGAGRTISKFTAGGHSCHPYMGVPSVPSVPSARDPAVAPKAEYWGKPTDSNGSDPDLLKIAPFLQNGNQQLLDVIFDSHSPSHSHIPPQLDQNDANDANDAESSEANTHNNSGGNPKDALQPSSSSNGQGNSGRQPLKRNNNGDHPDGRDQKRRRSTVSTSGRKKSQQKFACPFYRYDPWTHYGCLTYELHRIGDVRQHITRRHVQEIRCPRCGLVFEGESTNDRLAQHIQEMRCEVRLVNNTGVTADRLEAMRTVANGSSAITDEEKWYKIWDCLFPGFQRPGPGSPYLPAGFGVASHFIEEYQQQFLSRLDIQQLIARVALGPCPEAEISGHLASVFNDMSLFARQRTGGPASNGIPEDIQTPILSNGNMSFPMLAYPQLPHQNPMMDPENQMGSMQMDDVDPYLVWQPPNWSNE